MTCPIITKGSNMGNGCKMRPQTNNILRTMVECSPTKPIAKGFEVQVVVGGCWMKEGGSNMSNHKREQRRGYAQNQATKS